MKITEMFQFKHNKNLSMADKQFIYVLDIFCTHTHFELLKIQKQYGDRRHTHSTME